jgi:hypothetical protein
LRTESAVLGGSAYFVRQQVARIRFMGATGWSYFVPYEADVSAALQRLREDVFTRGDYDSGPSEDEIFAAVKQMRARVPEWDSWIQKCKEAAAKLPESMRAQYIENAERMKKSIMEYGSAPRKPKRKPKTIEKLLEIQAESGTHSILDIVGISPEPKFGHIRPFPHEKLVEIFGSQTPSHREIEEAHSFGRLEDFADKWEGIYVITYRDGLPSEIFFTGHSGD